MTYADNTEHLVKQMRLTTRPLTDERILKDAFATLEKSPQSAHRVKAKSNNIKRILAVTSVAAAIVIVWSAAHYLREVYSYQSEPKQIFNDLVKAETFCISNYHANSETPFEQVWVAKQLEMKMFSTIEADNNLMTLWDISRNVKMSSQGARSDLKTVPITKKMHAELDKSLAKVFSLSRFTNLNDIPKNAEWQWDINPNMISLSRVLLRTQVCELTWQQKNSAGKMQYLKWLILLNIDTRLPGKTELYTKSNLDDQYVLASYSIILYPGEEEIKNHIRENFGPIISSPEYQPTGGQ
jgi:hypothetical protein